MLDTEKTRRFVDQLWEDSIIPALIEYIRIPNKSPAFDPDWEANGYMQAAAELLDAWCDTPTIAGMRREIVTLPGRTPVLFLEIPSTGAEGTVLLYGHYDKQPEFTGWEPGLGPWEPVLRDGRLYGRGGADDGYALFGSLTAIAALEEQGVPHARCVVLIEGCEESGSFDLPYYVDALSERIGDPDLVICLDSECGNYDQLWLTTSLRGMLTGSLHVNVLTQGQHSGAAGGIVPSSFRLLRQVMERVENARTGALHESLYVTVPAAISEQTARAAEVLGDEVVKKYPWAGGTRPETDNVAELLLANAWQPCLATVGLAGAPAPEDAGNTLRPGTSAKLVFRLPPTLDAESAAQSVKAVLETDPPNGAPVTFEVEGAQSGWAAPPLAPWLEASVDAASRDYFGRPGMHLGIGASIPFMKMLGDSFPGTQFMITGVLGPQSNAHGPNEFLEIATGKRLTCCVARVLADHASQ